MPKHKPNIVILGSGNMAYAIAHLFAKNATLSQVYSTNKKTGKALAGLYKSEYISDAKKINPKADWYFLCVPDDKIASVSKKIKTTKGTVVHLSGSRPLNEIKSKTEKAVIYPFTSIHKNTNLNQKQFTVFTNGSSSATDKKTKALLQPFHFQNIHLSDIDRLALHINAVIANNFINHLLYLISKRTKNAKQKLLLERLVHQAVSAFEDNNNYNLQTGPARRKDKKTQAMHLKYIGKDKSLQAIYKSISTSIQKTYNHE